MGWWCKECRCAVLSGPASCPQCGKPGPTVLLSMKNNSVQGRCKIHGNVIYIRVLSIKALPCVECVREGYYNEAITQEAMRLHPQLFEGEGGLKPPSSS